MSKLEIGNPAPDFTLPTDGGGEITLSGLKGKNVVIYFYPKDDTPGCTVESCDFRDNFRDLGALNTAVIGISKDSVKSHDKFKAKYDINFTLASDEGSDVCERYGVWKEKNMMGKKFMGIERTTFLVDTKGRIAQIWHSVKVEGHAEDVKNAIKGLAKAA